ncbi:hypothetical protein PM082_004875 [Marasmius tenuissimus]|nr:hypothetical protein PM082_004875 [Marasmius tenuissimus]
MFDVDLKVFEVESEMLGVDSKAFKADLNVSSVNIRDILVVVIVLAAVGGPYTLNIPCDPRSPSSFTDNVQLSASLEPLSLSPEPNEVALDMAPFPANQDNSL